MSLINLQYRMRFVNRYIISIMGDWTFITTHGLVLIYISTNPQNTTREIAAVVNITERSVHRVINDLESEGYLTRSRKGRKNVYEINPDLKLRHDITRDTAVGDLIEVLQPIDKEIV